VLKLSEESIEEMRFNVIKKILDDFPELKERLRKYLQEENENKE
jgi:hypothetical protein